MRSTLFCLGVLAILGTGGVTAQIGGDTGKSEGCKAANLTTRSAVIPFRTEYVSDRNLRRGAIKKVQDGKNGRVTCMFFPCSKGAQLVYKTVEPAENEIYLVGAPSRSVGRGQVVTMVATAYDPSIGKHTATGKRTGYGIAAVDPRFIKLGTRLFVEGYGYAVAADTGGAIKGRRIDLCQASRHEANRFGRRKVRVHVLK